MQGPRIKHVCRHASVALGQSRAMVPEDVPRLSALPLREREEIAGSPTIEGEYLWKRLANHSTCAFWPHFALLGKPVSWANCLF